MYASEEPDGGQHSTPRQNSTLPELYKQQCSSPGHHQGPHLPIQESRKPYPLTYSELHTKNHQTHSLGRPKYLHSNGSLYIHYFPGDIVHHWVKQYHQVSHLQQSETQHPWKTPAVVLHSSSQSATLKERGQLQTLPTKLNINAFG